MLVCKTEHHHLGGEIAAFHLKLQTIKKNFAVQFRQQWWEAKNM